MVVFVVACGVGLCFFCISLLPCFAVLSRVLESLGPFQGVSSWFLCLLCFVLHNAPEFVLLFSAAAGHDVQSCAAVVWSVLLKCGEASNIRMWMAFPCSCSFFPSRLYLLMVHPCCIPGRDLVVNHEGLLVVCSFDTCFSFMCHGFPFDQSDLEPINSGAGFVFASFSRRKALRLRSAGASITNMNEGYAAKSGELSHWRKRYPEGRPFTTHPSRWLLIMPNRHISGWVARTTGQVEAGKRQERKGRGTGGTGTEEGKGKGRHKQPTDRKREGMFEGKARGKNNAKRHAKSWPLCLR